MNDEYNYETIGTIVEDPDFLVVKGGYDKVVLKINWTKTWATGTKQVTAPFELFGKVATAAKGMKLKRGMHVKLLWEIKCERFVNLCAFNIKVVTPVDSDEVPA